MRIALLIGLFFATFNTPPPSPIEGSHQLIVVVTHDWNATTGTLTRYDLEEGKWQRASAPAKVVIGRAGLAWGRGINLATGSGPAKAEGDGKSPAGVFPLGDAFGFASAPSWLRLPYVELKRATECVDDATSTHYNAIVDRNAVERVDWSSSEKMRSIPVYEHGVVVVQNDPPKARGGSCIFLHLVSPGAKPTAGCTSMSREAMDALLRWIDPARDPLLVQLPQSEYDRLRPLWHLP